MKICWDNLEKLEYRSDRGDWQDKKFRNNFYVYKERCKNCSKAFLAKKGSKGLYCEHFCVCGENHYNYGKKLSEEHKQKMSENHANYSGENNPMYGEKHSEQSKLKISELLMGRKCSEKTKKKMSESRSGKNNPAWKGGISCEPYCDVWLDKDFKESIKKRDGYQCLNPTCSKQNKIFCVHHINYNKKDCILKNLITLCNSCNSKANANRKWHEAWYNAIIYNRYGWKNV